MQDNTKNISGIIMEVVGKSVVIKSRKKSYKIELENIKKAKARIPLLFEKYDRYSHEELDAEDFKRMVRKLKVYKPDDDLPEEAEMQKVIRMMGK